MFFRKYLFSILWSIFILILTGMPPSGIPKIRTILFLPADKAIHFFLFGIFSFLISWEIRKTKGSALSWKGLVIPLIYGYIIEVLQKYIFVWRSFEWADILADSAGALLVFFSLFLLRKNR